MNDISCNQITDLVAKLCIEANVFISDDIKTAIQNAYGIEESKEGQAVLEDLLANIEIAKEKQIPVCQDTGMAVVFVEIGQDAHITGGDLTKAINDGVAKGYTEGFLRASVVNDPLLRINTKDNTPAVIHYDIVSGDHIKITVAPKGFGSENMSAMKMLKPSDGIEGVKQFILETVIAAGPNPCPPIIVGAGIGGTIEKAAYLAKTALLRNVGTLNPLSHIADLEKEMLVRINNLGIGPGGLGGRITALAININVFPTHIAGLPVVVNIGCHVTRHATGII
ncbi:MAG: fumarate hydratase [Saccharofermentanales bacterium]